MRKIVAAYGKWATFGLIFTFLVNLGAFAGNAIQLTNLETGKSLKPITVGMKVIYMLKPNSGQANPKSVSGILSEVTATTATINGVTVNFSDLDRIGSKASKSLTGGLVLSGIGLTLIRVATAEPQTPPGGFSTTEKKSNGGKIALTGLGIGVAGLGIYSLFSTPSYDLNKWSLEVVDVN